MRSPLTGYVPFRLRIATPGAPDDGEHTTGEFALSPVAVAVTLGVIILLACMRLGCSFDMSACAGLATAAGHSYAHEHGMYDELTTEQALQHMAYAVQTLSRLATRHFRGVCVALILVFLLR